MKIYFSSDSAKDLEMMDYIKEIHQQALSQFKNQAVSQYNMEKIMNHSLEIGLNTRFKSRGGRASLNRLTQKVKIEINYRLHKENKDAIKDTYLHELGHVIEYICFNQSSHDWRWKSITESLGGSSEIKHNLDTSKFITKRKRFTYTCGCQTHIISSITHNRVLKGLRYSCAKCKNDIIFKDNQSL